MIDHLLVITWDASDAALEDVVLSRLYLTPSTGSTSQEAGETATLTAWFDSPEDRQVAVDALRDVEGIAIGLTERERLDWLERYEQSLEPMLIGQRFVVAPDRSLLTEGNERLAIVIPQEQAFGTGSHETTSLCLEILESLDLQGKRGLDVGSGSGILAIAMHRLGAQRVVAFDNDPDAYGALRDNRLRNGVPESAMALFIGGIEPLQGGEFDVITMNILPEVIVALLPQVTRHLSHDGRLIVSGVLTARREDVVSAAGGHGLGVLSEKEKGEWWAAVLGRP